jgi:O-antigen ligase/tetratricopeptide (TPR) repeat protein
MPQRPLRPKQATTGKTSEVFETSEVYPTLGVSGLGPGALDTFLLRIVDGGLAGSVLLVPFLMGGRQALGQLVLVALAVAAALAWTTRWCVHRRFTWRATWAALLLLAGAVLVALQAIPLPQSLLRQIAPRTADFLPLWPSHGEAAAQWGPWQTVSLTPAATRAGLAVFLSYALLFLVAVHRVRTVDDVERVLRWCALAAVLMALFGLAQFLAGNGKFYWFYEHPFSRTSDAAKGAFTNRNHFAQFLALGIGPLIWWFQDVTRQRRARGLSRSSRSEDGTVPLANAGVTLRPFPGGDRAVGDALQPYLLALALGIVLFAGLLSFSRGGMTVLLVAAVIAAAVCYRASSVGSSFVLGIAAAGLLIVVSLMIFGAEPVSRRLEDLSSGSAERLDPRGARRAIWAVVARAIPNHWVLGSGVGSHAEVYPMHLDAPLEIPATFTHAENSYLQVALETGIVGLGLVLSGMACCASWCIAGMRRAESRRMLVCLGAITASLAACALHAAVDFVWYVPGCMTPVALLAACALRSRQLAGPAPAFPTQPRRLPRPLGVATVAVLLAAGTWMIAGRIGPVIAEPDWHRYELARDAREAAFPAMGSRGPETARKADLAALDREKQCLGWLQSVVRWQPDHAQAHVELAQCHLRIFDLLQSTGINPMPLPQLRDAAVQSRFSTREELTAWLARAVGDHWQHLEHALRHARQGLALCPLQGKAYVYVGELAFLEGDRGQLQTACVDQAIRVRPFDGEVLYAAAMEALVAGDLTQYVGYLQRSFRCGRTCRQHVIRELVTGVPEEGIEPMTQFLIETFSPGLEELRFLQDVAARRAKPGDLVALRRRLAAAAAAEAQAASGAKAAALWLEACRAYAALGDGPHALRSAQSACACDPNNYDVRYALSLCLIEQESFAEAQGHLSWCLRRRPEDRTLEQRYKEALRGGLDRRGPTAAREGEDRR